MLRAGGHAAPGGRRLLARSSTSGTWRISSGRPTPAASAGCSPRTSRSSSNFDGDRLARERDYQSRSLAEGLAAFAVARRRNVERLRAVPASAWKRAGFQESFGSITLADVPRLMAEHDRSHTDEIRGLLAYLRTGRTLEHAPDFRRRLGGGP